MGLLEELLAEVRALRAEVGELRDARQEQGDRVWMNRQEAALYLGTTSEALRAAEAAGQLEGHRTATGRPVYRVTDLDAFATAGDQLAA
jgi:hypothetical protein